MKVTVVIRTYNRPEFLKECLASVELQTHTDWEVLIFDDGATDINFNIYKKFKLTNSDKRIMYITVNEARGLYRDSWLIAPDVSDGAIIVRLDDDDLLANDALKYISDLYQQNPDLDFSYGSTLVFEGDELTDIIPVQSPNEVTATKTMWAGYTIPNNHPWRAPYCWYVDYYTEPHMYTSIIHCSKTNILCVFHLYTMRTKSVKAVKDKITITSTHADDLEFLGSLDYLGLAHTSIHKFLTYFRNHTTDRVTGNVINGVGIIDAVTAVRDKVEHLRPAGFHSRVIPIDMYDNHNNGITDEMRHSFKEYRTQIKNKSLEY